MEVNKIYQGDCLEVMKTFEDKSINCVITSPPYYEKNIRGHGDYGKSNKGVSPMYTQWFKPFKEYSDDFFKELKRIVKSNGIVLINYGYSTDYGWTYPIQIIETGLNYFKSRDMIIWNKPNPEPNSMGGLTHSFEFWFILHNSDKPNWNIEKGKYIRDVFTYKQKQIDFKIAYHGCPYPIEMIRRLIEISSKENDLILDPFVGTGTTCVASKQLNRKYIGIEINNSYVQICENRLKQQVLSNLSPPVQTSKSKILTSAKQKGFNMRYQENSAEFSQMPNGTSDNANIPRLRPNSKICSNAKK